MANPWDRREGEGRRAYAAFLDYCAMGARRTLRALHAEYLKREDSENVAEKPPTVSLPSLFSWSMKHEWQKRVDAWDAYTQGQAKREWADFYDQWRQKERKVAQALLEKAEQMLRFPVATITRDDETGTTVVNPADWRFVDVARLLDVASKLARLAAGEETDRTRVAIDDVLRGLPQELGEFVRQELVAQLSKERD